MPCNLETPQPAGGSKVIQYMWTGIAAPQAVGQVFQVQMSGE